MCAFLLNEHQSNRNNYINLFASCSFFSFSLSHLSLTIFCLTPILTSILSHLHLLKAVSFSREHSEISACILRFYVDLKSAKKHQRFTIEMAEYIGLVSTLVSIVRAFVCKNVTSNRNRIPVNVLSLNVFAWIHYLLHFFSPLNTHTHTYTDIYSFIFRTRRNTFGGFTFRFESAIRQSEKYSRALHLVNPQWKSTLDFCQEWQTKPLQLRI